MPLPTFVAGNTFLSGVGAITPALPAGIAADDILLLFLETHQQTATIPTPNGGTWTQTASSPQGSGGAGANSSSRVTVFWSRYNGTQGDPTTNDPGDHISGRMQAYRGVRTTGNPWNITSGAGGTSAVSVPGATTTPENCFVVMCITSEDDGDTFSFPFTNASLGSVVGRGNNTHADGDQGHIARSEGSFVTPGAYGATTTTLSPSGEAWGGITLALEPPILGTTGATLGDATLSATGQVIAKATLAVTLGDATLSATGQVIAKATLAVTLGDATLAGTGTVVTVGGGGSPSERIKMHVSISIRI